MARLPEKPDIDHLKRQAKELLTAARAQAPDAMVRVCSVLPAFKSVEPGVEAWGALRLHDAQSCIAREYGFASWPALRSYVEIARVQAGDQRLQARAFAERAYAGDLAGGINTARPAEAAKLLASVTGLGDAESGLAPAIGDVDAVRAAMSRNPGWIDLPAGPLNLPPLVAATHSGLLRLPEYRARIHATVALLLEAGADPNQSVGNRWPPASLATPSDEHRISALYGAAGRNHDPTLTEMLLEAGADPNDGESLYHALEAPDCTCVQLLLDAGAHVAGTNAPLRALDFDNLDAFKLILSRTDLGVDDMGDKLLFWAIRRRRSAAHIQAILDAGGNALAIAEDGTNAWTQALRYGLPDVLEVLERAGATASTSDEDAFLAVCALGDTARAKQVVSKQPDIFRSLSDAQLRMLPELAAAAHGDAVRTMADIGWPLGVRGGDWNASAINHAVMRGDAALARFLLARGASWRDEHGFGDNACGTLSWASINQPEKDGDWLGCAAALVEHGMPGAHRDPEDPRFVVVDGLRRRFSEEVTDFLLEAGDYGATVSALRGPP